MLQSFQVSLTFVKGKFSLKEKLALQETNFFKFSKQFCLLRLNSSSQRKFKFILVKRKNVLEIGNIVFIPLTNETRACS